MLSVTVLARSLRIRQVCSECGCWQGGLRISVCVAQVRVRVWQRTGEGGRQGAPLFDLRSADGAVEVGGGPWWSTWRAQAGGPTPQKL